MMEVLVVKEEEEEEVLLRVREICWVLGISSSQSVPESRSRYMGILPISISPFNVVIVAVVVFST